MDWIALLIPIVAIIAVFTFVAVATWSDNRRKERESYYRHETYRKIMERPGDPSAGVLELMREEELQQRRRRIAGLRLGGMITFVSGAGAMIFLYFFLEDVAVYLAGIIPVLIGLVLMVYGFFVEKPNGRGGSGTM